MEQVEAALAQQPAPSAPVGVDEAAEDAAAIDKAWGRFKAALAQQPAAVDGAMVERALAAYLRRQEDGESLYGCVTAALTAALAGQQQGGA